MSRLLAADNFVRANGGLGTNWTTATGHNAPAIVSNQVQGGTVSSGNAAWWNANPFPNDQWAQSTINADANVNTYGGVFLRVANGAATMYRIYVVGPIGATAVAHIAKTVAGAFTDLNSATITLTAGDVIRGEVNGSALSLYQNNVLRVSTSDSSIASGAPGLIVGPDATLANAIISAWSAGDLGVPNGPMPWNRVYAPLVAQ